MLFSATPYQDPKYFLILIPLLLPIIIGLWYGKRLHIYGLFVTVFFLYVSFGSANWRQGIALIFFLIIETIIVSFYSYYRKSNNNFWVYSVALTGSLLPLLIYKITPFVSNGQTSLLGFLGISYLTFKAVQTVMEIRDGAIKDYDFWFFLQFLAFFPTISSGPIDRYRRFKKDFYNIPSHDKYRDMLYKGVHYLFLGFLYNFILSHIFGQLLLPPVKSGLLIDGIFSWYLIAYMYIWSMYLFFNFAGYSLFAVSISYFMGIETPMNFDKPFKSKNIKEFWNRWHISLSFWFRDYVFMRLVFFFMKKKTFKSRKTTANITYVLNMLLMGLWHGETWFYILYGLVHGLALVANDWWIDLKKKYPDKFPHNRFTEYFSIFVTFNFVCFTFLIFSGILDTLLFHRHG